MRQQLINILNGLNAVETKGNSSLIIVQCMQQLAQIIDSLPNEKSEDNEEDK